MRAIFGRIYWGCVKRVSRLAYLHHVVDSCSPDSFCEVEDEVHEILVTESGKWCKRANKVHVAVSDIQLPEGATSHWNESNYGHGSYIGWDTLRKFKKLVEDAEYERRKRKREGRELWVKWFTAVAATIAALASLLTLYFSHWSGPPK